MKHLLEQRLAWLAAERRRLVGEALGAREDERRRLAEELHDEVIQSLIVAQQELEAAARGEPASVRRLGQAVERALAKVRDQIAELHPVTRPHRDLAEALRGAARRAGEVGGFRCEVDVDPAAHGFHDDLLFALGRELLTNIAQHAEASTASLTAALRGGRIVLEVADDGGGMGEAEPGEAVVRGHIGLETVEERVAAAAGSLEISARPGGGTLVRAELPVTPPRGER